MRISAFGIFLLFLIQPAFGQNQNLISKIEAYATENDFSGTVVVSKEGDLLYQGSFGFSNQEEEVLNDHSTEYPVASITKLFTSVITLQLVEEGKIDLNSTINQYLPDYNKDIGEVVTVHHLLTHTSGLKNSDEIRRMNGSLPDIYIDEVSVDEIIKKYCSGPLVDPVGAVFDYNNAEYILLGKIIETQEQTSFEEVLKQRILIPLKMNSSGLIKTSEDMEGLAQGYKWNSDKNIYEKDPPRLFQNYYSSGAMFSTASDLMKFTQALYNSQLISNPAMELLLRTYPVTRSYGYGLWVRYPNYNNVVPKVTQRFGQIWGINSLVSHFMDQEITVIVLANTDKIYVSEFQNIIGEELLSQRRN